MWGTAVGMIAGLIYGSAALAVVMAAAILLNLIIAALVGVFVPLLLERSGRGFFLFLGLARMFLL